MQLKCLKYAFFKGLHWTKLMKICSVSVETSHFYCINLLFDVTVALNSALLRTAFVFISCGLF